MNRRYGLLMAVVGGILLLTGLHYTAGHDHGAAPHHLYRRLYYFPILAAAWGWGARGGLAAAAAVIAAYVPHAFGLQGMHPDPASTIDKVAEILGIPFDEVMQAALSPLAFTVGTDFKPARHRGLDGVLHVDGW